MGGGNQASPIYSPATRGLSPRGRGKLPAASSPVPAGRSIPAWAGETSGGVQPCSSRKVYPRVGGGNHWSKQSRSFAEGLSPRGRGKHLQPGKNDIVAGSIPAWAGETPSQLHLPRAKAVYPRVGGGNGKGRPNPPPYQGLSPRGRGKHQPAPAGVVPLRSIPAWAGETGTLTMPARSPAVYPRVGGGNWVRTESPLPWEGLSPRGRGKQTAADKPAPWDGSIPAWAGETCSRRRCGWRCRVYPRVGGGNRSGGRAAAAGSRRAVYPRVGGGNRLPFADSGNRPGLSPRGRGKPVWPIAKQVHVGSIPAWAGETVWVVHWVSPLAVYPRVGGGNVCMRR